MFSSSHSAGANFSSSSRLFADDPKDLDNKTKSINIEEVKSKDIGNVKPNDIVAKKEPETFIRKYWGPLGAVDDYTVDDIVDWRDNDAGYVTYPYRAYDYNEKTLGFPVIRPPPPLERIREGMRLNPSSPIDYPYIQEFKQRYDILIIGGGLMGSSIAYWLSQRFSHGDKDQFSIAVVEKDPSYRNCNTTLSLGGLRQQFSLPEHIEMSLFGADFMRNAERILAVPTPEDHKDDYFNLPNVRFQPHGYLVLADDAGLEQLKASHEIQKAYGVQSVMLTPKQMRRRFPWLNTHDLAGGCLGVENEGCFDTWNLLQAFKLKAMKNGVDYIHGDVIDFRNHRCDGVYYTKQDGTRQVYGRPFEAQVLLDNVDMVYPIEFSRCVLAAGGDTRRLGEMCDIGKGYGALSVPIPVEKRKRYIYTQRCANGPGLDCPTVIDPSGTFFRRQGYAGDYLCGKNPTPEQEPTDTDLNWVDSEYFDKVVQPNLTNRVSAFENMKLENMRAVNYDHNMFDESPIVGMHPYHSNVLMACGFGGHSAQFAPAVGRAIQELILDDWYTTIDLSRFSFDRILNQKQVREASMVI